VKLFLKNKSKTFAKNHCEIQVRIILVCIMYSIKYGTVLTLKANDARKKVGSTKGMQTSVKTSQLLKFRAEQVLIL